MTTTMRAGIVGFPLGHSVSPAFQQAAFDHLGIDARYERWATPPDQLAARIDGLREPGFLGANVTVPYKQDVMGMLDDVDPGAARIGAVNTIVNRDGRLTGFNTDAEGFVTSLRLEARRDPAGLRGLIVGAGGAARAVAFGLADAGIGGLVIANRTPERAEQLARAVHQATGVETRADGLPLRETYTGGFDLIVNCTSVGMSGGPDPDSLPPLGGVITSGVLVCDLVYNPHETPLLRAAHAQGAACLPGLGMLIYQGAAAFQRWTGHDAPIDVMYTAARDALGQPESRNAG